jgi:hypothetical protein
VRKYMLWTLVLAGMLAIAITAVASAEKPTVVRVGNVILALDGDVFPVALPEDTPAPITLKVSGAIATADGSQPPPIKKVIIETAKDGYINAKGLPACTLGRLEARDTKGAEKACPNSIVGKGSTTVRVAFPESAPFRARGKIVAFNGGVKDGITTMLIHTYVAVPTPTALVTTVKSRRVQNGPLGLRSVATIPAIAGGSGSIVKFDLTIHRLFTYKGEKQSYLEAKCEHDSLLANVDAMFGDGSHIAGLLVRPCKVRM